uniref:C3H1-type domain-containing protein n=1 Tax=Hucho hucho TaxID=62062 RepID=A0A4W5P5T2_9TELE
MGKLPGGLGILPENAELETSPSGVEVVPIGGGGGSHRGWRWFPSGVESGAIEAGVVTRGGFLKRGDWSKRGTDRSRRGGRQFPDDGRLTLEALTGKGKKNMTKEFKDQNALEIDGRLICRHFLRGKCIKGDDCQLEHALDVNYSINEVCNFYIQGSCSKGESCVYMHNILFSAYSKCPLCSGCRWVDEGGNDCTLFLVLFPCVSVLLPLVIFCEKLQI